MWACFEPRTFYEELKSVKIPKNVPDVRVASDFFFYTSLKMTATKGTLLCDDVMKFEIDTWTIAAWQFHSPTRKMKVLIERLIKRFWAFEPHFLS